MGAVTIQQMADRVAQLLKLRLGVRGHGLEDRLARARRHLPRGVRAAGGRLASAAARAQNPKLLVQIDEQEVARDYDACLRYLMPLNRADRTRARVVGIALSILFSLLGVILLLVVVLRWRGLV